MAKIIKDDVNVCWLNLKELFDLSDVEVKGDFDCRNNNLISLKGAPHTVNSFDCRHNQITSLEGSPRKVKQTFNCSLNKTFHHPSRFLRRYIYVKIARNTGFSSNFIF